MTVLVTTSQLYRIPCFRGLFEYHPVFTDRWRVHAPVYLHRCTWCSAMLTGQRKMNKLLPVMGHETSDGEKEESMWLPRILDKAGMTKSLCLFLPRTLDSCYVALKLTQQYCICRPAGCETACITLGLYITFYIWLFIWGFLLSEQAVSLFFQLYFLWW